MRPPCSGAVASTSAAAAAALAPPSLHQRRRRRSTTSTMTMHHHRRTGDSSAPSPLSRSLHASAMTGDVLPSLSHAARRSELHKRSDSRLKMQQRQPSSSPTAAAASSSSSGYVPPTPVNYFDSDAFVASPPPPESLTRPAYNRYRATVDIERSTVKGWEDVIPSAGDPDWRPPAVDFWTLAAYPIPWLRFKVLPAQLTFVVAELWSGLVLPLWRWARRSWVVFGAAAVDRRVFGRQRRKSEESGGSGGAASSSSSSSPASSSLSVVELALQRWHGKRSLLGDLRDWALALRGT